MDSGDEAGRLKASIRSAFAQVARPDPSRLLSPRRWSGEEKALRDFRKGAWPHWWDVPPEILGRNAAALVLFAPEALQFYLPAFLTLALDQDDAAGLILVLLTPGEKPAGWREFQDRFGGLDSPRREAIAAFLRFWRDRPDALTANQARIALERFWER
jgi:hypothetical protein